MRAFEIAKGHLGLKELPGVNASPIIAGMFAKSGHEEVKSDEVAWCAAFVGACLFDAGIKGTNSLAARSYLKWGQAVDLKDAQPGDVVVFWRGSPDSWQGHVAFFESQTDKMIRVLGGNQNNSVSLAFYPKARLLGVRRAVPPAAGTKHQRRPAPAPSRGVLPEKRPPAPPPDGVAPDPVPAPPSGGFFMRLWRALSGGF
jgi:uncharacterized protein (TIGR02594 family)